MANEDSKRRHESGDPDRPESVQALGSPVGDPPEDGWESPLAMDEDSSFPLDHCAVLSEN
jgi:hypothetical protein